MKIIHYAHEIFGIKRPLFLSCVRPRGRRIQQAIDLPLSHAFARCHGVYLFEQSIESEIMFSGLYPQLFAHIYGEDNDFSGMYYLALENGILKKEAEQFRAETEV